jgi:Outer membrane cobalamin receptor protein
MAWAVPAIPLSAQTAFRDSVELNPIVVTASHSPKTLKDASVVTRLITLHDIKISDATNMQDLLIQEMPGLEFGFAMGQETSLNMSVSGGMRCCSWWMVRGWQVRRWTTWTTTA